MTSPWTELCRVPESHATPYHGEATQVNGQSVTPTKRGPKPVTQAERLV